MTGLGAKMSQDAAWRTPLPPPPHLIFLPNFNEVSSNYLFDTIRQSKIESELSLKKLSIVIILNDFTANTQCHIRMYAIRIISKIKPHDNVFLFLDCRWWDCRSRHLAVDFPHTNKQCQDQLLYYQSLYNLYKICQL